MYRIYYYGTYSGVLRAWGLFYFGGIFMDKVFKTYDEQISLLNSRGIEISTSIERSDAKKALQHYGYYNLINGYKMPFW